MGNEKQKKYSFRVQASVVDIRIYGDFSDFKYIRDYILVDKDNNIIDKERLSWFIRPVNKGTENEYVKRNFNNFDKLTNGCKLRFSLINRRILRIDKVYLYNNGKFEETTEVEPKPKLERRTRGLIKNDKRGAENA